MAAPQRGSKTEPTVSQESLEVSGVTWKERPCLVNKGHSQPCSSPLPWPPPSLLQP
jgi:hypothetical protein